MKENLDLRQQEKNSRKVINKKRITRLFITLLDIKKVKQKIKNFRIYKIDPL